MLGVVDLGLFALEPAPESLSVAGSLRFPHKTLGFALSHFLFFFSVSFDLSPLLLLARIFFHQKPRR